MLRSLQNNSLYAKIYVVFRYLCGISFLWNMLPSTNMSDGFLKELKVKYKEIIY